MARREGAGGEEDGRESEKEGFGVRTVAGGMGGRGQVHETATSATGEGPTRRAACPLFVVGRYIPVPGRRRQKEDGKHSFRADGKEPTE